jgi:hypothetical protein
MMKMKKNNKQNGYTLLFAVLVSSLVLSVGISILTIGKKEFLLSTAARESVHAFYAADTGLSCAVYWDSQSKFSTSTPNLDPIPCGGSYSNRLFMTGPEAGGEYKTFFHIKNGDNGSCARVTVFQKYDDSSGTNIPVTTIESRGYNMGWNSVDSTCTIKSVKRVERAIRYTY